MHAEDYKIAYLYFAIHYYFVQSIENPLVKIKYLFRNRYSLLGVMLIFNNKSYG